jgi:hypothetical protein
MKEHKNHKATPITAKAKNRLKNKASALLKKPKPGKKSWSNDY